MFVREVYDLMNEWMDEADGTYLGPARSANVMRRAYSRFQAFAATIDDNVYVQAVNLSLVNMGEYDLSLAANPVRLLGNPVGGLTGARLQALLSLDIIDATTGQSMYKLESVGQIDSMAMFRYSSPLVYLFDGRVIRFSRVIDTATMRLRYRPFASKPDNANGIDWTKFAQTDNEFIDDFGDWQDLIALYAARELARIDDTAPNLHQQVKEREGEFERFLAQGRDRGGSNIQMTYRAVG